VTTVLVVGLGDLGSRVFGVLARSSGIERLVGVSRAEEAGARVAQAGLVAHLAGGPRRVAFERHDVSDGESTSRLLRRLDPDLVVMAASRHTWLRAAPPLPYGAWLPLQLTLVQRLMEANEAHVPVVCLPYPDAVGPALAPLGLAPLVGAGNVTETAAKLELLAGEGAEARLVMHHAAQRFSFGAFGALGGDEPDGEPPWRAEILVNGEALARDRVEALFRAPYPLPPGSASHDLTAAATGVLVEALLADRPRSAHAPAPHGLPGGYPVRVGHRSVELDLPAGIDQDEAVEINERAARWDGLERIEADGTIVYTAAVAAALGIEHVAPHERDAVADELERRRNA
jgi:hypothetical protein